MAGITDIVADLGRPVRVRFGHSIGVGGAREIALPVHMDMQEAYALLEAAHAAAQSGQTTLPAHSWTPAHVGHCSSLSLATGAADAVPDGVIFPYMFVSSLMSVIMHKMRSSIALKTVMLTSSAVFRLVQHLKCTTLTSCCDPLSHMARHTNQHLP